MPPVEPVLGGRRALAVGRRPSSAGRSARAAASAISAAWSYPRSRRRVSCTGTGTISSPPAPTAAQRAATASPSGTASRRSPAYLSAWSARRTVPANGAHHSSWRSGCGGPSARPERRPGRQPDALPDPRQASRADRVALGPAAGTHGRQREVHEPADGSQERRHALMVASAAYPALAPSSGRVRVAGGQRIRAGEPDADPAAAERTASQRSRAARPERAPSPIW